MTRARDLIQELEMRPHPEGGYYKEVYRSDVVVDSEGLLPGRSALTYAYFLLERGQHSAWHRLSSDEGWHFIEGEPLELIEVDVDSGTCRVRRLGPIDDGQKPLHVVRAGCWQAARPLGSFTLVACAVAPGFDFDDFRILDENDGAWPAVERAFPAARELLEPSPPSASG